VHEPYVPVVRNNSVRLVLRRSTAASVAWSACAECAVHNLPRGVGPHQLVRAARAATQIAGSGVFDETDPLHVARAAEVTSLWRLAVRW